MSNVDVSKIKPGDWVRAEFEDPDGEPYTVEGTARRSGVTSALLVGDSVIRGFSGHTAAVHLEHKPKRMKEPGYGEHVRSYGMEFVRTGDIFFAEEPREWTSVASGARLRWNQIIDPQPVTTDDEAAG